MSGTSCPDIALIGFGLDASLAGAMAAAHQRIGHLGMEAAEGDCGTLAARALESIAGPGGRADEQDVEVKL